MAEQTAVSMGSGFTTNAATTLETPSPRERVDDPTSGKEEPCPPRRSARMSSMRSSAAYCGPASAAVPAAGTVPADLASQLPPHGTGASRARLNGVTLLNSSPDVIDISATSFCDARRAVDGQALQGGTPTTERHESRLVVGNGTATTAGSSSSWVRFAWEPLDAVGGSRNLPVPAAGSGTGVGSTPETSGVTLLQELSGGLALAHQGHEKGVKRARASSARGAGEEIAAGLVESSRNRQRSLPDRAEWNWGAGWPRRQQCWRHEPRTGGHRARTEPGLANSFSMPSRELAGAAEVAGRPKGAHGHAPLPAVGSRDYSGRSVGGVSTRSSAWDGDRLGDAKEEGQAEGIGATTTTTAAAAYQKHREQDNSQEGGARAKKPRYHRSRVQRTLSVAQMDTLTVGVSSLGVASPEATNSDSDGGKGAPPALNGRPGRLPPRDILNDSTMGAFHPEPLRPGVGGSGDVGGAGGAGARFHTTGTRSQTARSGAAVGSLGWHHQPKRRRNGSLSASGLPLRNAGKPSVLPVDDIVSGTSTTSAIASTSSSSAAAATAGAAAAVAAAVVAASTPHSRPRPASSPSSSRPRHVSADGAGAQTSPNRRRFSLSRTGARTTAGSDPSNGATGCGAMVVERSAGQERRPSGSMPPPPPPCLPRTSSSLARTMQQGGGGKEAPGFDAAVSAAVASSSGDDGDGGRGAANGGKGEGEATTVVADAGEDDNSSDGGAAHEDLSAWLHSTDDWWTT